MIEDLRELYQEVILEHNRNPRNFREMADADHSLEGFNPLCGDRYTIYVKLDGDVIREISFSGSGCAISKASASIMCNELEGKRLEEAEKRFAEFVDLVTGEKDVGNGLEEHGRIAALAGVREFPLRVKCATLAWHTLRSILVGESQAVTTE